MWASGYDWREKCEEVIEEIGRVMGFDAVWSVHLNDSKTELASRKDRHENLGDGLIGGDALKQVFLDSRLSPIPFILETPDLESLQGAAREVGKLRGYLGHSSSR
jgi:deoxyribonuclease-4